MTPAQLTLVSPDEPVAERIRSHQRDRYLDLLRFLAVVLVLVVHVVPFVWYPATFPAVGIVFAIDASLLAGSLDRSRHRAFPVIKKRLLRLLAPLWAMAAVFVAAMVALGWTNTDSGQPLEATSLLQWLVPVSPPPASDLGHKLALPFWLWALSCYLWLLVLSPVLLWVFQRWPRRTLALPLTVLVLNALGAVPLTGAMGEVLLDLAAFGTCWLLGFAHHDGMLTRIRLSVALVAGAALYGIGIACAYAFASGDRGPVPEEVPVAYGLLSIGLVLVLLRLHPLVGGRLGASPFLTGLVTAVSQRAMTIYLWGNACLSAALFLVRAASGAPWWPGGLPPFTWPVVTLAVSTAPLLVCAVGFGWVEDKAAGRPVRLNPWPAGTDTQARGRGRHRRSRLGRLTRPPLTQRTPSPRPRHTVSAGRSTPSQPPSA